MTRQNQSQFEPAKTFYFRISKCEKSKFRVVGKNLKTGQNLVPEGVRCKAAASGGVGGRDR
jgi:hypothetical protein